MNSILMGQICESIEKAVKLNGSHITEGMALMPKPGSSSEDFKQNKNLMIDPSNGESDFNPEEKAKSGKADIEGFKKFVKERNVDEPSKPSTVSAGLKANFQKVITPPAKIKPNVPKPKKVQVNEEAKDISDEEKAAKLEEIAIKVKELMEEGKTRDEISALLVDEYGQFLSEPFASEVDDVLNKQFQEEVEESQKDIKQVYKKYLTKEVNEECDSPGEKINSEGEGKGLAKGKGLGPKGKPTNEGIKSPQEAQPSENETGSPYPSHINEDSYEVDDDAIESVEEADKEVVKKARAKYDDTVKNFKPGEGKRFTAMVDLLKAEGKDEESAKKIAVAIGKKKYGGKKFTEMAKK